MTKQRDLIALMRVYVRLDNFTTKPHFQSRNLCIFSHEKNPKAEKMKRTSMCNGPEDENNLVQTRLGGEFWASDVIMYKAYWVSNVKCFVIRHLNSQ